jgi:glycosyltransferase involved in cell wall biosynthesis
MKIIVMTTLYNAEKYIGRCIESVKSQTYRNFKMIIVDDLSTDNSSTIVKELIKDDDRFVFVSNVVKRYMPGNYYHSLQLQFVKDEDIVVNLDGDDWFSDSDVLSRVFSYYFRTNYLMSFGQFVHYHSEGNYSPGFTRRPNSFINIRQQAWTTSHLRTFKAKVFKAIKEEDLIGPTGNYWETTGDLAIIFPMIEMVDEENIYFTNDINLIYNVETSLNDYKVDGTKQNFYADLIRSKEPYKRIF